MWNKKGSQRMKYYKTHELKEHILTDEWNIKVIKYNFGIVLHTSKLLNDDVTSYTCYKL